MVNTTQPDDDWKRAEWNMHHAAVEHLNWAGLSENGIAADILRLDAIHPVVSGNKLFKLKPYLDAAVRQQSASVVTFGGAWSNHIIAAAYAARQYGIPAVGIIRGEAPSIRSPTLEAAMQYGMQLRFVSRAAYAGKTSDAFAASLAETFPNACIIPEGGFGVPGIAGSETILAAAETRGYSHIISCIGTGTMFIGLVNGCAPGQQIIGIPVLRGMHDLIGQFAPYISKPKKTSACTIFSGYHFGGYARKTPELLQFMNHFFARTGIPTDFVYTAKLMFAFTDLLAKNYFPPQSRILLIHSGGLQGNASLPAGTLAF